MNIEYRKIFVKKYELIDKKFKLSFKETLDLFLENPHHEILRRHFLKDRYTGYESIDVTSDYRAIFKETKTENSIVIIFYLIGTHEELYG